MLLSNFFAVCLATVPLTLAATVPKQVTTKSGAVSKAPSATREEVIQGIPCPALRAMAMNKKFDAAIKDWSDPRINLAQGTEIFQKTFNLQPDFSKFTINGASKLSRSGDGVSLVDIRAWGGAKPIPGQLVHPAAMSRTDPKNDATHGAYTPRPFDPASFSRFLGHLKGASELTIPVMAAARKAEVDDHKDTIGPLEWFNLWAEAALVLSVLSADGTGRSVPVQTFKDFFEKGTLPKPASGGIGMASLTKVTGEVIFQAYKSDLTGLTTLLKRFASQGVASALKGLGFDYPSIAKTIVARIGTNTLGTTISSLFSKILPA